MFEKINQPVSMIASFKKEPHNVVKVTPYLMQWGSRRYKVDKFGLYHPERRGTKRVHIFSFSSGSTAFRVELDPDTLEWTLAEAFYEG